MGPTPPSRGNVVHYDLAHKVGWNSTNLSLKSRNPLWCARVWWVSGDPLRGSLVAKSRETMAEQILGGVQTDVFHRPEWLHGPQPSHLHTSYQGK